ncbi:MAG: glutamine--fructose-6-phosphate aminotransferase, partial [Chloroflexi bacterium]|nr:glutamine--fructose-6-phosphate aminotransferase [Chloroflexota bacterium]
MCGIVGYVGSRMAASILLDGLAHLEYRGYDSAGIAVAGSGGSVIVRKAAGKLSALVESLKGELPDGSSGIGHTRWATHGGPTFENAHPHTDCAGNVVIVHNGIVENYLELKEELLNSGHAFESETDTEVMSHLIESHLAAGESFEEAVRLTACRVRGAQALVAMEAADPTRLVAFRMGNAGGITVGYGKGEMYLASDLPALLSYTNDVAFLSPGELVTVDRDGARYRSIGGGEDGDGGVFEKKPQRAPYDSVAIAKGGYRHFMLKEIMEQPEVISKPLGGRLSFNPSDVKLAGLPFT